MSSSVDLNPPTPLKRGLKVPLFKGDLDLETEQQPTCVHIVAFQGELAARAPRLC